MLSPYPLFYDYAIWYGDKAIWGAIWSLIDHVIDDLCG